MLEISLRSTGKFRRSEGMEHAFLKICIFSSKSLSYAEYSSPSPWQDRQLRHTPESSYWNRRSFVKQLGLIGAGSLLLPASLSAQKSQANDAPSFTFEGQGSYYPAKRNETYTLDRPLTAEVDATQHNNFYEFITRDVPSINQIAKNAQQFDTSDWKVQIKGLVEKKGHFHLGDLIKEMGTEERLYRFRCVERWAMAVPWTGFSLAKLIQYLKPDPKATYIRFTSAVKPSQMPGIALQDWYNWPYREGLRLDEAMNELAFVATGIYGKPLPKQNGAPIRLVVPWKYGYKNIKSIIRIEFIKRGSTTKVVEH